ncbi:MAG TPA: hypothetical protein EYG46_19245 [Myxococcales bacterium]|nr:hypothetical protein [Myxococcales bacterium]HIM03118.1 hypothetical protein [Myxococcales bacterium]
MKFVTPLERAAECGGTPFNPVPVAIVLGRRSRLHPHDPEIVEVLRRTQGIEAAHTRHGENVFEVGRSVNE